MSNFVINPYTSPPVTPKTWSDVGLTNCTLSDSDQTATATSATNYSCRANSTDISDSFSWTVGGGSQDNFRFALVTDAQRTSGSEPFGASDTSFMVLLGGLSGATDAWLFTYTDGASDVLICSACIDMNKTMKLERVGSTWTFYNDGVAKATYSSSSDFYFQCLVQNTGMFGTFA